MESLESALKILLEHAGTPTETQELPLLEALHRVAAEDVTSPVAVPPFDRSPLDGYALHSEDIAGARPGAPRAASCDRRGLRGLRRGVSPCPGGGCARHDGCARAQGVRLRDSAGGHR